MAANFTWSVSELACKAQVGDATNVVYVVYWQCNGSEVSGGVEYTAGVSRNTTVVYDATTNFIPYEQLTESEVMAWVWAENNGQTKQDVETELQYNIDQQINPPLVHNPLPWAEPAP